MIRACQLLREASSGNTWHDKRGCPQHVEIVYLAQQVLHVLQVVAPGLVLLGEKILDDVPEPFDPDPQSVERNLRSVAQRAAYVIRARPSTAPAPDA